MPFIQIQTNVAIDDQETFLKKVSSLAAQELGKPESVVMTACTPGAAMTFGGSSEPAVFIECKSIGLGSDKTKGISAVFCSFCESELGVDQKRVFIHFDNAEAAMWGWKGSTLG